MKKEIFALIMIALVLFSMLGLIDILPEQIRRYKYDLRWHCEKIDCGEIVYHNVTFKGSLFTWRIRNCRTINCHEFGYVTVSGDTFR